MTVQAQNGTNSADDLTSIQNEIGQRLNEINRISEQTDFNGVKVLQQDGGLKIQVGANDNEAISIDLQRVDATSLGLNNFTVSGDQAADLQTLVSDFGASGESEYEVSVFDGTGAEGANAAVQVDISNGKVTTAGGDQLYVSQTTGNITSASDNVAAGDPANTEQATAFANAFAGLEQGDSVTVGGTSWTRDTAGTDTEGFGNATYSATIEGQEVVVSISASTDANGADAIMSVLWTALPLLTQVPILLPLAPTKMPVKLT